VVSKWGGKGAGTRPKRNILLGASGGAWKNIGKSGGEVKRSRENGGASQ